MSKRLIQKMEGVMKGLHSGDYHIDRYKEESESIKITLAKSEKMTIKKLRKRHPDWEWRALKVWFGVVEYEGSKGDDTILVYLAHDKFGRFNSWKVQNFKEDHLGSHRSLGFRFRHPSESYETWSQRN